MSQQTICHFNKFGFCKYGKQCFRYHESKVCENADCEVLQCSLRHPKRCRFYAEYHYCKFGEYCKFSHERVEDRKIKLIKKELDEVKKHLSEKEMEIKKIDEEIRKTEMRKEEKIRMLLLKNEVIEKELRDVKIENKMIKENITDLRNDIKALKCKLNDNADGMNDVPEEVIEDECATTNSERQKDLSLSCDNCDFVAKSEGGLKTHKTAKHKGTVSLRAFSRVTR